MAKAVTAEPIEQTPDKRFPDEIVNMPVEVYLPLLEADENNIKPEQKVKITINGKDHFIERGRRQKVPYFVYRAAKVTYPQL
jgi:hypothetical protein